MDFDDYDELNGNPPFHPSSPMGMFMKAADAGWDSICLRLNQAMEEEKRLRHRCTFCGRGGENVTLKTCSRYK